MESKLDTKTRTARATEQEYAHQYTKKTRKDDYQYPEEHDRISHHSHDSGRTTEELYNVTPEETIVTVSPKNNKIKAVNVKDVAEDHRQRSYKIKMQPQIYGKTDIDDNINNPNDAREDEINKLRETSKAFAEQIELENSVDMTNPVERYSERVPEVHGEDDCQIVFNIGDKVTHIEENINGEVKFVNDKRVAVVWEDKTRERFALSDAREFLKIKQAYVGDIQEQIDPIHTPDWPKNDELENKLDNALSYMENENDDDIKTASIDIEKVKMQRKISELENKINEVDVEKVKTKAANEVISLMQKKCLLSEKEEDVKEQFDNIMNMDDASFESFKKAIVSAKKSVAEEDEIYAILGEDDDFSDIEDGAEMARAREAMKKETKTARSVDGIEMGDTSFFENGGLSNFKGNIGDFSAASAGMGSSNSQETRSLSASKRKPIERKAGNSLDMSGFQNIQGLKAPISIPDKQLSARGKFADLFDNMGWSGTPKNR